MDEELRSSCLKLFEACLAKVRSGKPGPSILTSHEFEANLAFSCDRLKAGASKRDNVTVAERSAAHRRLRSHLLKFPPSDRYADVQSGAEALAQLIPLRPRGSILYQWLRKRSTPTLPRAFKEQRNSRHFSSSLAHDRFVPKDRTMGKVIGTSFGGFGRKFFGRRDLEPADTMSIRRVRYMPCPTPILIGRRRLPPKSNPSRVKDERVPGKLSGRTPELKLLVRPQSHSVSAADRAWRNAGSIAGPSLEVSRSVRYERAGNRCPSTRPP